jgi:hypothetical protein
VQIAIASRSGLQRPPAAVVDDEETRRLKLMQTIITPKRRGLCR